MKNKIDFYKNLKNLLTQYGLLGSVDYCVECVEEIIGKTIERNFEKKIRTELVCCDKKGNPILVSEEKKDPLGRKYNYSGMKRFKW